MIRTALPGTRYQDQGYQVHTVLVPGNTGTRNDGTVQQFDSHTTTMRTNRTAGTPSPAWANPNGRPTQPIVEISDEGVNELLEPFSTLDEPVSETIMRDVRAVGSKLRVVMLPLDRNMHFGYSIVEDSEGGATEVLGANQKKVIESLKDWDLW